MVLHRTPKCMSCSPAKVWPWRTICPLNSSSTSLTVILVLSDSITHSNIENHVWDRTWGLPHYVCQSLSSTRVSQQHIFLSTSFRYLYTWAWLLHQSEPLADGYQPSSSIGSSVLWRHKIISLIGIIIICPRPQSWILSLMPFWTKSNMEVPLDAKSDVSPACFL